MEGKFGEAYDLAGLYLSQQMSWTRWKGGLSIGTKGVLFLKFGVFSKTQSERQGCQNSIYSDPTF
jgi:hypothetical protein